MDVSYKQLIENLEMAREQGDYPKALLFAEEAVILSAQEKNLEQLVNALAQKLLIYFHLFEKTENQLYNDLMYGDVQTGLQLVEEHGISGQSKAVMLLRTGDYYLHKNQPGKTVDYFALAIQFVDPEKKAEYAEYLNKWGYAESLAGDVTSGQLKIEKAEELVENDKTLRPFHKLIISSGISMRLAHCYFLANNQKQAKEEFAKAKIMADELSTQYSMPMRLLQIERLQNKLNL